MPTKEPAVVPGLGAAVERRRRELKLTPKEFADATGLTVQGLIPLRKGHRRKYQQRLTDPVCTVLGWTPDSIDRLLAGGKPKLLDASTQPDEYDDLRVQVGALTRAVWELLEIAGLEPASWLPAPPAAASAAR